MLACSPPFCCRYLHLDKLVEKNVDRGQADALAKQLAAQPSLGPCEAQLKYGDVTKLPGGREPVSR